MSVLEHYYYLYSEIELTKRLIEQDPENNDLPQMLSLLKDALNEYSLLHNLNDLSVYRREQDKFFELLRKRKPLNERGVVYSMFTFTIPLDKKDDKTFVFNAKAYVESIVKRREKLGIVYMSMVEELTDKGCPHWHICLGSIKSIKPDVFKHYGKIYGRYTKDGTNKTSPDTIIDYINKGGEMAILLDTIQ